jgi:hypothetical protein
LVQGRAHLCFDKFFKLWVVENMSLQGCGRESKWITTKELLNSACPLLDKNAKCHSWNST